MNSPIWNEAYLNLNTQERGLVALIQRARIKAMRLDRHLKRSARVLDIGCGSGKTLALLAESGFNNLHGVDVTDNRTITDNFTFVIGSLTSIPYPNGYFDACLIVNAFHHLDDTRLYEESTAEIRRCLKPGGYLFVVEPEQTLGRTLLYVAATALPISFLKSWKLEFDMERREIELFWRERPLDKPDGLERFFLHRGFKSFVAGFRKTKD